MKPPVCEVDSSRDVVDPAGISSAPPLPMSPWPESQGCSYQSLGGRETYCRSRDRRQGAKLAHCLVFVIHFA